MLIGGVLLASGMEMDLLPDDYRYGDNHIRFLIEQVLEIKQDWVLINGTIRPTPLLPWTPQTLHIRVASLKRSMALH
jgi:hypothetical protein